MRQTAWTRFVERATPLVLTMALAAVAISVASLGPKSLDQIVTVAAINLVLVLGTYLFVGNSGVLSFGQMAFAAIGAYTAGLLHIPPEDKANFLPDLPSWLGDAHFSALPAILMGGVVAAAVAAILSVPLMRLSGLSAGLASLSLLFIGQVVARAWVDVTRGGKSLAPIPTSIGTTEALIWALITIAVVFVYQLTPFGLRLRSSREDDVAAQSIGVAVGRERGIAFVLSALFCGFGGALYGLFLGTVNPDLFFISITFLTVTMLVIGGITSVAGAVVGTIVVSVIAEILRRVQTGDFFGISFPSRLGTQTLVLAIVLFLIILLRPDGLTKGKEIPTPRFLRRRAAAGSEPTVPLPERVDPPAD
ncbi:MAG: branched-chain amino acid ABC transporter permease [Thermoleophilia bacterium]